jgi:quinolinate synthase
VESIPELQRQVRQLLKERDAVLLVHYYQRPEVQDIADHLGDSLELSLRAASSKAKAIVFAGVDFMAETAKLVNPDAIVLHPNVMAKCPMAAMVDPQSLRAHKAANPGVPVVAYVNTSAAVKAESDICCTSANAVEVVGSLGAPKVTFIPDTNLGLYVQRHLPDVEIICWPGYCHTHRDIQSIDIKRLKEQHPEAEVVVHPECTPDVIDLADHVASTSGIVKWVTASPSKHFIIGTEAGLIHHLKKLRPDATFIQSPPAICPNMKRIGLVDVRDALVRMAPRVELPADIVERARRPVERMLALRRPPA